MLIANNLWTDTVNTATLLVGPDIQLLVLLDNRLLVGPNTRLLVGPDI